MKRRIHDALLGIVGLAGVAFLSISGMSCETTQMQCAVGHGAFTTVYKVKSGDEACYADAHKTWGAACSQYEVPDNAPFCTGLARVEHNGFATFLGVQNRKETPVTYKDADGNDVSYTVVTADGADYNTRTVAAKSYTMGTLFQEVGLDKSLGAPYAIGKYSSNPDGDNICYAGDGAALSVAELNIPDAMDPAASIHYRQEWNDVRFYVTEGAPGTQVKGTMKFENVIAGCSVEYEFLGLYPAVFCGLEVRGHLDANGMPVEGHEDNDGDPATDAANDTDDDGDPMTPVDNDDDNPDEPDEDYLPVIRYDPDPGACNPKADPANGRPFGSGINPDFKTYCHPEYVHCVLEEGTELVK
jgi:hypothetical protein